MSPKGAAGKVIVIDDIGGGFLLEVAQLLAHAQLRDGEDHRL